MEDETKNPANGIKDLMWSFLMDKGQKREYTGVKSCGISAHTDNYSENSRAEKRHSHSLGDFGHGDYENCHRSNRTGLIGETG